MRSRLKSAIFFVFSVLLASSYSSCDLINPDEQIPSFLRIDSISMATGNGEGNPDHNIVDAWVYENEKLLGIFELPAVIPILVDGEANIRIRGGIKLNGQVGTRIPYLFTEDYLGTISLFPDSVVNINPTLNYQNWVTFDWLEDFDNVGLSLITSDVSDADIERINGIEAFDGKTLKLALAEDEIIFECKSGVTYELPGSGTPVLLEFTYRSNHSCVVGLFSRDQGGTFQVPIIVLSASEDWNRIYVNLTDVISSNSDFINHQPFFGFVRDEDHVGEAYFYIDNIRMLH